MPVYVDAIGGVLITVDPTLGFDLVDGFVGKALDCATPYSGSSPPPPPLLSAQPIPTADADHTFSVALSFPAGTIANGQGFLFFAATNEPDFSGFYELTFFKDSGQYFLQFDGQTADQFFYIDTDEGNDQDAVFPFVADTIYLVSAVYDVGAGAVRLILSVQGSGTSIVLTAGFFGTASGSFADSAAASCRLFTVDPPDFSFETNTGWIDSLDIATRAWSQGDHDEKWNNCSGIGTGLPFASYSAALLTDLQNHWDFSPTAEAQLMVWIAPWWPSGCGQPPVDRFEPLGLFDTSLPNPVAITAAYSARYGRPAPGSVLWIITRTLSTDYQPNARSPLASFTVP